MKENTNTALKFPVLILYVIVFYSIWIMWEFWGRPVIGNAIENEYLSQLIKSGIIKNLVWTLPAILLVNYFQTDMYAGLKTMFTVKYPAATYGVFDPRGSRQMRASSRLARCFAGIKVRWIKYLPIFLLFTIYLLVGALLTKGRLAVSETFRFSSLITVLFVGITEEMVFRGWLLNATVSEKKKWGPVMINALLFLFIHFPIWIYEGHFVENFQNLGFLSIIILSIIFSWTFIKSKNIWIPILLHMYWDLLMFLFY